MKMLRIVLLALAVAAGPLEDGSQEIGSQENGSQEGGPQVQTANGIVRGTHHVAEAYSSFTGIPYATAPAGRQRFGAPLAPPSFDGIFDADQNNIFCPQIMDNEFIGTEDCLNLNVFTPDAASQENRKAVIVYFYGGSYISGSNVLYGPDHLISHDVVLVIPNFRVGILGLLCLGHELVPGNAAFKDQVAALQWVKQNIAAFGGDPDNVTIMGHSSGGASVDLLTLSPMTAGLFHRSITVSASSLAVWAVGSNPVEHAFTMAKTYLGFEGDNIEELIELCLNADAQDLATAVSRYHADVVLLTLPVAACVEGSFPGIEAFLKDTPSNIFASGDYTPLPKIYTVTDKEYVNMVTPAEIEQVDQLIDNLEHILPIDLHIQPNQLRRSIAERVRNFYLKDDISTLESYIDYRSDTIFYYGIARAARQRVESNEPVYVLEFSYESDLRRPRLPETDGIRGVGHGDDALFLIFPTPPEMTVTAQDQLTIDRYTTLVSNFAKYGNPMPDVNDLQWPPLTSTQFHYLQLGSEVLVSEAPRAEAIALWDEIYAEVEKPHVYIEQGLVRGTHNPEAGYSSFLGIQYGSIPDGRDRYASPAPPPKWQGTFVADQDNILCPQAWNGEYFGTKDCLILNVYTPDTASETNQLAVIVYIHGFLSSSNAYFGPDQLLPNDVVLVTVNYRVGPLGHLCLGHELVPGNAAFKDQVAALRWVRDNIAAFGGNPDSVTIMGQSSGGVSVDLLTLSPMTAGLFNRAISLSGAARSAWAIVPDPVAVATLMAETYLDYNGDSLEDLVEFYLTADVEDLSEATFQLVQEFGNTYLLFAGCVEQEFSGIEAFLTDMPADILASGEYTSIPKLYTVTNKEYVNIISPEEVNNITEIVAHLGEYLPNDLKIETANQRTEIVNRLRAFYVNDETSPLEGYIDFMSDSMFYHGMIRSARERQATSYSPVYVMEFAFESALRVPRLPAVNSITGTGHGDDLLFVVARIEADTTLTPADQDTTERYSLLFSNFAKYGEPTPQNEPVAWLPITDEYVNYLELGSELTVSHSPNAAAMALWDEIYLAGTSARILPSLFALFLSALFLVFNLR